MAVIPVNVTGPFDARTDKPAPGIRLEYSPVGAVLEPVTAPAQIIVLAPDMWSAAISILIWSLALIACISAVKRLSRNYWRVNREIITGVLASVSSGLFVLILYSTFTAMVRIPNWRAVVEDPDIVLAELQTHTFGSHDGLISARDNLRWHGQRGCAVVAITEHDSPEGSLKAADLAESDESLPAVLPGVETGFDNFDYVIAITSKEQFLQNKFDIRQKPFVPWFRRAYQGVVLVLEDSIRAERVEQVVATGIDGFDVANDGHPSTSVKLRKAILSAAAHHHLPLVAWTDWHGIGGILRSWTAFRIPGAAALSRQQRATAVLDALRRHDCSNITPLTIGRIGRVTPARVLLAPFIESGRYALSLSAMRLLVWWIWAGAMFLFVTALMSLKINPWKTLLGTLQTAMGIAILVSCGRLFIAYATGEATYFFPVYIGLIASAVGIAAVLFGAFDIYFAVTRKQ
ncbi:MAG: hypothetical protein ABSH16_12865 [Sedimentisphaerales bacterium]